MGKKTFITYGNNNYKNSLIRIKKEAELLGCFDDIKIYTERSLPNYISESELFHYKRGGGYWIWKPYIILNSLLEQGRENDIVVYSDAGNQLFSHKEWDYYWNLIEKYDIVLFTYGGVMKKYARRSLLNFFEDDVPLLYNYYQVQSGFIIAKKKAVFFFQEWQNTMLQHPNIVIDVEDKDKRSESHHFVENRHDQAVLTGLAYKYEKKMKIRFEWQHSESKQRYGQAVFCARISDDRQRNISTRESLFVFCIKKTIIYPFRNIKMFILKLLNNVIR